ncbi:MAG TPA: hypothetical protein VHM29_06755, partial [Acidimicrobiia bacterium]|nr:hypothetical protein [Acidimicrobiia bacterium]
NAGYPTSSNRASSLHLHWLPRVELKEVAVTITVPRYPASPDLYFWALQTSFVGPEGISGGAHLGLQWHQGFPGGTAVNWGGYDSAGSVLAGTDSTMPSPIGNPHTRAYSWGEGGSYRLSIGIDAELGPGWWRGAITDLATGEERHVRSLQCLGDRLGAVMTWTEAFCRCDAEPVAVIWSNAAGLSAEGVDFRPTACSTTYQSESDGGCSNSDSRALPHGIAQITGVSRTNPAGTVLPLTDGN